MKYKIIVSC